MGCYEARRRDSSRVKLKFYVGWNCQSPLYVSPSPGILSPQTGIRQFVANISIHSIPTGLFLFLGKEEKNVLVICSVDQILCIQWICRASEGFNRSTPLVFLILFNSFLYLLFFSQFSILFNILERRKKSWSQSLI